MPRLISVAWSSCLVCGSRLSQQSSGACLSCALKVVYSTLLSLFDKCLGTLDAKWGICLGTYGWYMAVLLDTPAGKYGISPGSYLWVVLLCRQGSSDYLCKYLSYVFLARCVYSDLGSFPLEPKCRGWLTAILVDMSGSTVFNILYAILIGPMPFYWSCSPQWDRLSDLTGWGRGTGFALEVTETGFLSQATQFSHCVGLHQKLPRKKERAP